MLGQMIFWVCELSSQLRLTYWVVQGGGDITAAVFIASSKLCMQSKSSVKSVFKLNHTTRFNRHILLNHDHDDGSVGFVAKIHSIPSAVREMRDKFQFASIIIRWCLLLLQLAVLILGSNWRQKFLNF